MKLKKCTDHDNECPDVEDKWECWMYMPNLGYCPYIKTAKGEKKNEHSTPIRQNCS